MTKLQQIDPLFCRKRQYFQCLQIWNRRSAIHFLHKSTPYGIVCFRLHFTAVQYSFEHESIGMKRKKFLVENNMDRWIEMNIPHPSQSKSMGLVHSIHNSMDIGNWHRLGVGSGKPQHYGQVGSMTLSGEG